MLNSPEIPNNNSKTFLPKIPTQNSFHQQSFEQQNPNNFLLPINQNLMNNTGLLSNNSFLPSIFPGNTNFNNNFNPNMNTQIMESLKNAKIKKMQRVQRKNTEELVYKALEKQTEMLNEIAKRFKKQAEEDENKLLKKIKELERENSEILWQRRNEDIIQQKVIDKLRNLNDINQYNLKSNPFYGFLNPLKEEDKSDSESEKPKKKKKKKGKKKTKIIKGAAEKNWGL